MMSALTPELGTRHLYLEEKVCHSSWAQGGPRWQRGATWSTAPWQPESMGRFRLCGAGSGWVTSKGLSSSSYGELKCGTGCQLSRVLDFLDNVS